MLLPKPARRSHLQAFGLVVVTVFGLPPLVLVAVQTARPRAILGAGLMLLLLLAAATAVRPGLWAMPYRVWNAAVERLRAAVLLYLLAICYYLVLPVVGAAGSRLVRARSTGGSMWTDREPLEGDTYLWAGHVAGDANGGGGRSGDVGWLLGSGNGWALGLLPLLRLVQAYSQARGRPPANIYTLY